MQKFVKQYPDANILLYNLHTEYAYIMNMRQYYKFISPTKSWITEPKSGCLVINLNQCFWTDFQHIIIRANQFIVDDMKILLETLS